MSESVSTDMTSASLPWQPVRKTRTHEEVFRQIERMIMDGNLRPGDRLPNERALSDSLGVSRPSVREALRALEALQIITVRPGLGAASGATVAEGVGGVLSSVLPMHVALSNLSMAEVMEARLPIEVWTTRVAARRAGPDDLERLAALLDRMDDPELPDQEFHELDTAFHVGLAEAAGNRMVSYFMQALRDAITHEMARGFERAGDRDLAVARARKEHREIFDAVRSGDGESAANLSERHIAAFYNLIIDNADERPPGLVLADGAGRKARPSRRQRSRSA
jgi:GntR family transcriptional repressor for pyruvate dehydrogenase complex